MFHILESLHNSGVPAVFALILLGVFFVVMHAASQVAKGKPLPRAFRRRRPR